MHALARLAITRRWWVIVGWIALIVVLQVVAKGAGGAKYKNDFNLPHTESQTVTELLAKAGLQSESNAEGTVVFRSLDGTLASAPTTVTSALQKLCSDRAAHITESITPWSTISCAATAGSTTGRPGQLSPDKTVAIVTVRWDTSQPSVGMATTVYDDLRTIRSDRLQVEFTGDLFANVGGGGVPPFFIGIIAALIILGVVFRTFGATLLPLVSAIAALGSGLALVSLLTHVMAVADFAPELADLMVIGVGVDYALFIVTRHRRNLLRGMALEDSIVTAVNTSGRAVLFAGTTVCIAILGLCALGVSFLYGVAIGTSIGVALTMLASLTLLPALLRFLGLRVLPRKQRRAVLAGDFHTDDDHHRTRWYRWGRVVERRSLYTGLLSGALLVLLAIPFFSIRLGHADQGNDPAGSTSRKGFDLIEQAFGKGYNSTLEVVVSGPGAANTTYTARIEQTLRGVANVDRSSIQTIPVGHDIAIVNFKSLSGPQDKATDTLVHTLRDDALPPLYRGTTNHIYVFGATAIFIDFASVLSSKLPLFILAVVGLSFLLLVVAFRSIVIPLTAAVMNLLAAGSSFGIVVAVFQWGWLGDAIGVGRGGPIEAFLPVIFFAILFGLSMDYQVFLVSRMHEEWVHTRDNHRSVTVGQGETGGIITAAGLIMILVFGGFVLGDQRPIKLLGVGLASAIFLDAFVVRTMLVPSLMHRLGDSNWWFPRWLERITPRVTIEPPEDESDAELVRTI